MISFLNNLGLFLISLILAEAIVPKLFFLDSPTLIIRSQICEGIAFS